MKLKVETKKLQDMVNRAMKCASCTVDVPLTGMMAIEVKEDTLKLTTTDENTYLFIKEPYQGEDFYVVVEVEVFAKLISKLTSEYTTLELVNDTLEVNANGKYVISLPYNGEGELVKFPNPLQKVAENTHSSTVNLSTLKMIHATAEASLDKTKGYHGAYTGYYLGDCAVTTDSYKICWVDTKLFDEPALVRPETMELIELLSDEEVKVTKNKDYIMFTTKRCTIFSQLLPYLEDFQLDAISQLVHTELEQSCEIDKQSLLGVLDRLSLFVTKMDENGIYLNFKSASLTINSKQTDGVEEIEYREPKDITPKACSIDITKFTEQVKSTLSDTVQIFFGNFGAIKIVDGNITKVIALFDEE